MSKAHLSRHDIDLSWESGSINKQWASDFKAEEISVLAGGGAHLDTRAGMDKPFFSCCTAAGLLFFQSGDIFPSVSFYQGK